MERVVIQAITHKENMNLITGTLPPKVDNALGELRMWLWQQGETPQIQTQMSDPDGLKFCWSVPQAFSAEAVKKLTAHGMSPSSTQVEACGVITVIGSGFWQSPETMDVIHNVVVNARLLDIKNGALTIVVNPQDVQKVVKDLHKALIG